MGKCGLEVRNTKQMALPERLKNSEKLQDTCVVVQCDRERPVAELPKGTTPTQYAMQPDEYLKMMALAEEFGITLREPTKRKQVGEPPGSRLAPTCLPGPGIVVLPRTCACVRLDAWYP